MIGIIDTGICNITSLKNTLSYLNYDFISTNEITKLSKCEKLILPGVGTFKEGMQRIKTNKFDKLIYEHIENNKYLLGICLGMQLLLSKGFENGESNGLDLIKGEVKKLKKNSKDRIPHIGWNEINISNKKNDLLKNIKNKSNFYFIHSYYVDLNEKVYFCATTHGKNIFPSIINKNKIFGVQFHPEKSQTNGLTILNNFCKL